MARILVVDSDIGMLEAVSEILLTERHEPMVCQSVTRAIERMRSFAPDVITTNVRVKNGGNCFDMLRASHELSPAPTVIVISGCDTVETITEAMKRGAFDYLVKPVKADDLLRTIQRAINARTGVTGEVASKFVTCPVSHGGNGHQPASFLQGMEVQRKQKLAALAALILLICTWLFPPWIHYLRTDDTSLKVRHPTGYYFLFDTQQDESLDVRRSMVARIDFGRLSAESFIVAALGAGLVVATRRKRSARGQTARRLG